MSLTLELRNHPNSILTVPIFLEDLWPEIFKRLPAKTLCRFLCVCKNWNSIISSSSFLAFRRTFKQVIATTPNNKPYLRINAGEIDHTSYTLHNNINTRPHHLHFPFRFAGNLAGRHPDDVYYLSVYRKIALEKDFTKKSSLNFTCVDVIHGVVCISYSLDSGFDSTILWNPTIHKYTSLPKADFHLDHLDINQTVGAYNTLFTCHAIGFGYDESKNDFKVARIWIPCLVTKSKLGSNARPFCEVYSSGEGQWRRVAVNKNNNRDLEREKGQFKEKWSFRTSCYVNGNIHWLVNLHGESRSFVVALDCSSEELTTTEVPSEMFEGRMHGAPVTRMVLEYGSMLAVVLDKFLLPCRWSLVELWVMTEYGVSGTWHKLCTFRKKDIYRSNLFEGIMMRTPYGPDQWRRLYRHNLWLYEVLSDHIFEESLYLIDHPNAESYRKEDGVEILVT